MAEGKPAEDRATKPSPCCGGLRDLEKLGGVIWTVLGRWVLNYDCAMVRPATSPMNFCPYCGRDWRVRP